MREGRFEEAARAFATAGEVFPLDRAEALMGEGTALHESGDESGGLGRLRSAIDAAGAGTLAQTRALYLFGLRANDPGAFGEARGVLGSFAIGTLAGPLAPYVRAEYARALSGLDEGVAASAAWQAVAADPSAGAALRAGAYDALAALSREASEYASEVKWLEQAIALAPTANRRAALALAAERAGDADSAIAQLQRIVFDTPGSGAALAAVASLKALGVPPDLAIEGLVLYRQGKNTQARAVLELAAGQPWRAGDNLAFPLYYLGAALEEVSEPALAIDAYDAATAAAPSSVWAHRGRYWAARTAERIGALEGASARYTALVREGPPGEFTEEAAFRSGYIHYVARRFDVAVSTWDALDGAGRARASFWKARAEQSLGLNDAAAADFAATIAAGRLDFYALEAQRIAAGETRDDVSFRERNLAPPTNWPAVEAWLGARVPGSAPVLTFDRAREFALAGLHDLAVEALFEVLDAASDPWRTYAGLREAVDLGLADAGVRLAVRLRISVGVASADVPVELLRVSYPVIVPDVLLAEAREAGIDPLFLAALIRQESLWDPRAISPAGAIGLTQVIPPTGEALASSFGITDFRPADLLRPAVSIRFGARYVTDQVTEFGRAEAALSAYNGGPFRAQRWLAETGEGGAAEFVESVDIEETKTYVVLVLEHYAHYRLAYAREGR